MSKKDKYVTKDYLWKVIKYISAPIMIIFKLIAIILGLLAAIVIKLFDDFDSSSDSDDITSNESNDQYDDALL